MLDTSAMKLTFSDEFESRSISQDGVNTTWSDIRSGSRFDSNSDIGFGTSSFVDPSSGYDPFLVANGTLTITAVPDRTPFGYPGSWESGLITTQNGFSQTYGYFEMRADLADASGAWDAFWLLPVSPTSSESGSDGWQELDVVEHYGSNNPGVYSTIHTTDPEPNENWQQNLQVYSELTQTSGYHAYGVLWTAETIGFYVDGELIGEKPTPSDMHGPMYLLANLATDRSAEAEAGSFSAKIDYIRAYSLPGTDNPENGPEGIVAQVGADGSILFGTDGDDTLTAARIPSDIAGLGGADTILGGSGNDHLFGYSAAGGSDGADLIDGGAGDDYIQGNAGADSLSGGAGSDRINGGRDDDVIDGGVGDDVINGNLGADRIVGGAGNDSIRGGRGDDVLSAGDGHDILMGDLGADTLEGGAGIDFMTGGGDGDTFHFSVGDALFSLTGSLAGFTDVITDFTAGEDKIDLRAAPSSIVWGSATDLSSALGKAEALLAGLDDTAVADIQVGGNAYLFFSSDGVTANNVVRIDGAGPYHLVSSDFI